MLGPCFDIQASQCFSEAQGTPVRFVSRRSGKHSDGCREVWRFQEVGSLSRWETAKLIASYEQNISPVSLDFGRL